MLKFRYLLLILLLLFKVSALQAKDSSSIKGTIRSMYYFCVDALIKKFPGEPSLIENEQQLRGQGYTNTYIAGFDYVRENLKLAEKLRADKINPFTSHIQEFANLIDPHTEFIEEGVKYQGFSDKEMRLSLLEALKHEAQEHQDSQKVTYRYWFNLNFRLSILATPTDRPPYHFKDININDLMTNTSIEETNDFFLRGLKRKNHESIIEAINDFLIAVTYETAIERTRRLDWEKNWYLINSFPKRIIIPTIQPLGIISINNTHGTGVHLIGLNKAQASADRRTMYPSMSHVSVKLSRA